MVAVAITLVTHTTLGQQQIPQPTVQGESMQRMANDMNAIRAFVYGGNRADARAAAVDLVGWSKRMPDLFPPSEANNDYVDMSATRVRGAYVTMTREAEKLAAIVSAGSPTAVGDQLVAAERNGCGACHRSATH